MTHRLPFAAAVAAVVVAVAPAAADPVTPLPAPAVIRIPDSATRNVLPIDAGAPVVRGEFASPIRVDADRAALRASIERERAVQAERFARGAGPGIVVWLRRSRY
ncbi:MAG: hypothetical protein JWM87_187 [Candidatus Eremiobacteraeota bacterium]|nr:hypothetical protein [Candidatus Eremiobacteraeota bacterium]